MDTEERYVSVREAAEICGVHPTTVRKWFRDGKLPGAWQRGRVVRIPLAALAQGDAPQPVAPAAPTHRFRAVAGELEG